ncbi:aldose 1-epimerase family protein [Mesorhizobium sp. NBSH29]|uniref:aldose epimerase family protein n=1 Tax=Mesorhizobium sp. NBSH29 TaxID=2654249 RepID=UPI001896A1FF|nr:aldose 1-epimerase family protein [Mesorhizobium sp. NBSH29]QPC88281.1 aldose 1-epimerase family protein [Mesorhizobium sp. NBSH29]
MADSIFLTAGTATAEIAIAGAEPVAWSAAGMDLMWLPDPALWHQVNPILFPIVGRAHHGLLHVDNTAYPMPIHGFANGKSFRPLEVTADTARLVLADDSETYENFPFAFELEVFYRLTVDSLDTHFTVRNPDAEKPLPYALGTHPGFRWPFAGDSRQGFRIMFDKAEKGDVPAVTPDGLFSRTMRRAVPFEGTELAVSDALFAHEALCFFNAESQSFRFVGPDGTSIAIEVENFPHLAIWSLPGAPFVCLEAWTGHGDPEGFDGDIFEKPSMLVLAPGEEARHRVRMVVG